MESAVSLADRAERVDVETRVDNLVSGHRLRAVFPLGESASSSRADGQLDVKARPIKGSEPDGTEDGKFADCHPMETFVAIEGKSRRLALLAQGLP